MKRLISVMYFKSLMTLFSYSTSEVKTALFIQPVVMGIMYLSCGFIADINALMFAESAPTKGVNLQDIKYNKEN